MTTPQTPRKVEPLTLDEAVALANKVEYWGHYDRKGFYGLIKDGLERFAVTISQDSTRGRTSYELILYGCEVPSIHLFEKVEIIDPSRKKISRLEETYLVAAVNYLANHCENQDKRIEQVQRNSISRLRQILAEAGQ